LPAGGDPKLQDTKTIHDNSANRYQDEMPVRQQRVFTRFLREEMRQLGYL
jgi:hypothetical protein